MKYTPIVAAIDLDTAEILQCRNLSAQEKNRLLKSNYNIRLDSLELELRVELIGTQ